MAGWRSCVSGSQLPRAQPRRQITPRPILRRFQTVSFTTGVDHRYGVGPGADQDQNDRRSDPPGPLAARTGARLQAAGVTSQERRATHATRRVPVLRAASAGDRCCQQRRGASPRRHDQGAARVPRQARRRRGHRGGTGLRCRSRSPDRRHHARRDRPPAPPAHATARSKHAPERRAPYLPVGPHVTVGTNWGPLVMRDSERSARLCTVMPRQELVTR
jgi:hypothetical protein